MHILKEMAMKGELLFPAIGIKDCLTRSKFDNVYGHRHALSDSIMRATDVMIEGNAPFSVGKGYTFALCGCGARS